MAENTKRLATFVSSANFSDLPPDVIHETKRVLLDSIGCAMAGLSMEASRIVVEFAKRLGGPREATIIGTGDKVACTNAAFANSQLINAQDFDAGSQSQGHDTPGVIAGALAMIEPGKASGKDLILAIAIGHEVASRIKSAEQKDTLAPDIRGYSSVTLAAAASAGKLLNLSQEQMNNAIGIASFICPPNTIRRYFDISPVTMAKYTVFGQIAEAGVTAALLAQRGFTGDTEALDGENGFFKYTGKPQWDADKISEGLGEWRHTINYKRYPSNYPTAGAKDCFIDIIEENGIQPEEIEKITARIWPIWHYKSMHENKLRTEEDFAYHVPYQLACAAYRINPTRWLDPDVKNDPKLQAFMQRVKFDIGCDEKEFGLAKLADPDAELSAAEVVARGRTFKKQSLYRKGVSRPEEFRMPDEELIEKFRGNVSKVLSPDSASKVVGAVFELERLAKATDVMEMLAP